MHIVQNKPSTLNPVQDGYMWLTICMLHENTISRSESYSVLTPFLSKLRYAYRRNRQNLFYLLVYFKF